MPIPRPRTVVVLLCAALLLAALITAPALSFAAGFSPALSGSGTQSGQAPLLVAEPLFDDASGLGLGVGEPLLTIIYDAATYGETQPCPT